MMGMSPVFSFTKDCTRDFFFKVYEIYQSTSFPENITIYKILPFSSMEATPFSRSRCFYFTMFKDK